VLLLFDEDTCATNFMIRDARMQALVSDDKEPITPFIHRVRELYETHGVSSVLIIGGSGDYFDVCDHVRPSCSQPRRHANTPLSSSGDHDGRVPRA
jgi:predicted ABC-class ATPase